MSRGALHLSPDLSAAAGASLSLSETHGTIAVPTSSAGLFRQYRAFAGPAILVGVGYMDPGNWATDMQAGAQFHFGLLWVVALASLMALVLQVIATRLGVIAGMDLAQACRAHYPRWSVIPNWLLSEVAIVACDLAEVLGSAVALNLLFHIPLLWAVLITGCDVLLVLALQRLGMRLIEGVVIVLSCTIAICCSLELFVFRHGVVDPGELTRALLTPGLGQEGMATLAVGIIGATVMPHNLYLHSALVQSRKLLPHPAEQRAALRWNSVDSAIALSLAFFVNGALLVLAAITFNDRTGVSVGSLRYAFDANTDWIRVAYLTLARGTGVTLASILFALSLLASGQASTLTGTLAGQVVMEGFLNLSLAPWIRRLITRGLAILPAVLIVGLHGNGSVTALLVLSQVILALQLPFAMFPLLHLTSRRPISGGRLLQVAGWGSALLITALDLYCLPGALGQALQTI